MNKNILLVVIVGFIVVVMSVTIVAFNQSSGKINLVNPEYIKPVDLVSKQMGKVEPQFHSISEVKIDWALQFSNTGGGNTEYKTTGYLVEKNTIVACGDCPINGACAPCPGARLIISSELSSKGGETTMIWLFPTSEEMANQYENILKVDQKYTFFLKPGQYGPELKSVKVAPN